MLRVEQEDTIWRAWLSGELTIYHVEALYHALEPLMDAPEPIELDLSEVVEIDTAGVQVLIMLKKTSNRQHRDVRITAYSDPVKRVLDVLELWNFVGHDSRLNEA